MLMSKYDLTGQKFERLAVVKRGPNNKNGNAQWWCECDCGNPELKLILGAKLRNGETRSCGCLQKEIASENAKRPNKYDLSGSFGVLWTNNTNDIVYFDLEDACKILKHTWYIDTCGYPTTTIDNKNVRMHTFLGLYMHDHADKNKLNNRRENLRPCTQQENIRNRPINKNNTSGFTGVTWDKALKKWDVKIWVDKKCKRLGRFTNKESAIRARLEAESKYFGEFAPQRHLFAEYEINNEG